MVKTYEKIAIITALVLCLTFELTVCGEPGHFELGKGYNK